MFYSQFILAKKGPLGTIWIAAHLERKLRKNQVADTDIGTSVDSILFPEMPIALRLSSHLLLGVVRIYSKKVNYLFDDCSEALLKVKQAFQGAAVDLPPGESTAPYHSITLPETFDLDDFELPDNDILQGSYVDHHVGAKDQITLQDTMDGVIYSTSKFGLDERFGDGDASGLDLNEALVEEDATAGDAVHMSESDVHPQSSFQERPSLKHDENEDTLIDDDGADQMDDSDGDNEPVEYAEAPCTPGVWEEPNLSNIQETSACEDHQEPEKHYVTEYAVNENLRHASFNVPHEQECDPSKSQKSAPAAVQSLNDNLKNWVEVQGNLKNAGLLTAHEQESAQSESQKSATAGVQSFSDNLKNWVEVQGNLKNAGPLTTHEQESDQYESQNSAPAGVQSFSDNLKNWVEVQGNLKNPGPLTTHEQESDQSELQKSAPAGVQSFSDNLKNWVEVQGNLKNASSLTTHEQESDRSESQKLAPAGVLSFNDNLKNWVEIQGNLKNAGPFTTQSKSNSEILGEDENHDGPVQVIDFASLHSLEISAREEPSYASGNSTLVQGERPYATNSLDSNLQETHATEPRHDEVSYNATQVDNTNSYTSDFPAAEKLLSVPERFSDVRSHMLPESTPTQEYIMWGYGGSSVSSLMTQSSYPLQASGFFTNKTTTGSVPNNDDLLSSILVGRSSVLNMKPTPPPQMPSKRRRQSAPRPAVAKRKVPMDDNMVLQGDAIRQQLINTGDIRRLRKKAPCTWLEISMLRKQFLEDELFDETSFAGVSRKLASLHNQSYDISRIRVPEGQASARAETILKSVSQNDENVSHLEVGNENQNAPLELNVPYENRHEANLQSLANKDVWEAELFGMPMSLGDQPCENDTTNSHYNGNQEHMHATEPIDSESVLCGQSSAMKINGENLSVPDVGNSVASLGEISEEKHELVVVGAEDDTSIAALTSLESRQLTNASCRSSFETDGVRPDIATLDQDIEEIKKNEEESVTDENSSQPHVEYNAKNLVPDATYEEEAAAATEVTVGSKDVLLDDKESTGHQDAYPASTTHTEDNPYNNRVNDDEVECSADVHDTDFLNFDDDDDDQGAEASGDALTNNEAKRFIDNTGWSSRTRAVAKYLQVMFDKEGARGRMSLPMNNLLNGKTRKEASRMFFETLVLKTKDYIHVEQRVPFENIDILPRSKLLKSTF